MPFEILGCVLLRDKGGRRGGGEGGVCFIRSGIGLSEKGNDENNGFVTQF